MPSLEVEFNNTTLPTLDKSHIIVHCFLNISNTSNELWSGSKNYAPSRAFPYLKLKYMGRFGALICHVRGPPSHFQPKGGSEAIAPISDPANEVARKAAE